MFDTSNYKLDKPLPKRKYEKVIRLMNDKLGGKIMKEFRDFIATTYSYLIDESSEDKKVKITKMLS